MNLNDLLQRLEADYVHGRVIAPNSRARQTFSLTAPSATDHRDFKATITRYVSHHQRAANGSPLSDVSAFGLAKDILDDTFPHAPNTAGYDAALASALNGDVAAVIDHLAQALTARALDAYVANLYFSTVNPTEKREVQELANALNAHYTQADLEQNPALSRFCHHLSPVLREF